MQTIVKSSSGITLVPIESRLLSDRKLFIKEEITAASACEFVKEIMLLVKENPDAPIDVYINSPGGELDAGLLIFDTLQGLSTEVNLHCIGLASSVAAVILAGGKAGHRLILRHSRVMVHEPLIAGGVGGSATSLRRISETIMERQRIVVRLLAACTGRSREEIEQAISYDNYMNAEEAITFGLCDRIESAVAG